jgi:hypothetical protein
MKPASNHPWRAKADVRDVEAAKAAYAVRVELAQIRTARGIAIKAMVRRRKNGKWGGP